MGIQLNGTSGTDVISAVDGSLTVEGLSISGDFNIADKIIHTGDTNTSIRFPAADTFTVETGGTERLRIKSDGNIEISTTTDTSAHYLKFNANRSNDGDHLGGIYGVWNGNSVGAINILAGADTTNKDDGHLQFITYAGGSAYERLRINSGGRVNIANSNQTGSHLDYTRLNVYGQTDHGGTNKNLNLLNVYNYGSGNVGDITGIGLGCGASPGGYTKASIGFIRTGTYGRGDLTFYINSQGNGNQVVEGDERLRITSTGRVGINTNNPGSNLTVWANDGVTDTDVFQVRSKTGAFNIQVSDSNASNPEWALRTYSSEPIVFKQATTERLRINSAGDILLGTDQATIGCNTADGSDNRSFSLCGGSDASQNRGALVGIFGNEHGSFPGTLALRAGNVTGGHIEISTGGTTRHYINKEGRIGLNLNPNTWHSNNQTVIQMSATNGGLNIFTRPSNAFLTNNFYYKSDDAGVFQTGANYGLMYQLDAAGGNFKWHTSTTASSSAYSSASMKTRMVLEQDGSLVLGDRVGTTSPSTNQPVAFHSGRVNPDGADANVHTAIRCNLYVGSNTGWAAGDGGVLGLGGSGTGSAGQERMWAYVKGSRQSGNGWEYAGYLDLGTAGWSGNTTHRRARIWGNGQFELTAASTENTKLSVKHGTTQTVVLEQTGSNNMRFRNPSSGNFTFDTNSDYRLKENVVNITNALTTVKALKPYQYKWKHDGKLGQGFIAHEAQEVLPDVGIVSGTKDAVHTEDDRNESYKKDDPIYQGIDYSKLVPLLTAAIQELEARVASLESS